jgi:hypothetical protein
VISSALLAGYTKEIATMALDLSSLLSAYRGSGRDGAACGCWCDEWRLSARSSRGADHLSRLQFDHLLQHELHGLVARTNDQYDPALRP